MATVPESLTRRLTLTWETETGGWLDPESATLSALSVIEWLNDPENREAAQDLLEPFETGCQVELLQDLSEQAHKVAIQDDDTTVVAHAIGIIQLLEDLVREALISRDI